jgi:hypothetical protein
MLGSPDLRDFVWNSDDPRLCLPVYTHPSHMEQDHQWRLPEHDDLLVC